MAIQETTALTGNLLGAPANGNPAPSKENLRNSLPTALGEGKGSKPDSSENIWTNPNVSVRRETKVLWGRDLELGENPDKNIALTRENLLDIAAEHMKTEEWNALFNHLAITDDFPENDEDADMRLTETFAEHFACEIAKDGHDEVAGTWGENTIEVLRAYYSKHDFLACLTAAMKAVGEYLWECAADPFDERWVLID